MEKRMIENYVFSVSTRQFTKHTQNRQESMLTCGSGCQWPTAGCGAIGAPSSMSEQFSIGKLATCVEMILPVSCARVIVDRTILSSGIFNSFKRSPVYPACLRPTSVRYRSESVAPFKLYWPCRMRIKWRTADGLTFSNFSLNLFSSVGVAFDFNGFTRLVGSRLQGGINENVCETNVRLNVKIV